MHLLSLNFEEFRGQPREWLLENSQFGEINLIVGKNSTGKTRFLNVINGLAKLLSGEHKGLYQSGHYTVSFDFNDQIYLYCLHIEKSHVIKEQLSIDDEDVLSRNDKGEGMIFAAEMGRTMRFQTPTTELAAVYRRDSIQHPFLEDLYRWGKSTKHYLFGSEFGKNRLATHILAEKEGTDISDDVIDTNYVIEIFEKSVKRHGEAYKKAVLDDFSSLGYPCTQISVTGIENFLANNQALVGLAVQEKELGTMTPQIFMSQGMYRALALVIQLNFNVFEDIPATILVDDIGEGLDYSRSTKTTLMLIEKAQQNNFQLFMTTNDRYVMNAVELQYWSVLKRTGSHVNVFNKRNSPQKFEDFQYLGLNNFDFLSNEYFLGGDSES